jgi:hypothetical protein
VDAAFPAALAEDFPDFGRHPAGLGCDIGPSIAKRDDPECGARVVAANVTPPSFGGVCGPAVEFDADPEVPVEIVKIAVPPASFAGCLADGTWQPVGPFHLPDVAGLQLRMKTGGSLTKCRSQFRPPSQLWPGRHGSSQQLGRAESACAGPGDPRRRLIEAERSLSQIDGRFFDPRPRWCACWMARLVYPGRARCAACVQCRRQAR